MDLWFERRSVLSANGISTPRLYGVHSATILEEYIPFSFWDILRDGQRELVADLAQVCRVVDQGFSPVGIADFRSRGDDLVVIDFGEDMGPIGVEPSPYFSAGDLFMRQLEVSLRGEMKPGLLDAFKEYYDRSVA